WKKLADRLGIYFDEKINNRCRGVSRLDSLNIILEKSDRTFSAEEKLEFAQEKNLAYQEFLLTMTKDDVTKEVRETLEFLKSHGVKVAIGSSSKNAKLILQQVELLNSFDAISDGNNISKSKPNPEVFLKAAEMLNIEPKFCA
ncbi:MAG: HAD-IA family hydrolase, partial [Clostridia bacterium]